MPKEKFYYGAQVAGIVPQPPDLTVAWGVADVPQVLINDLPADRSGLNRLIGTLRRARDQVYGSDE